MRKVNKLTQRLDHTVPDPKFLRNSEKSEAYKQALAEFVRTRKSTR